MKLIKSVRSVKKQICFQVMVLLVLPVRCVSPPLVPIFGSPVSSCVCFTLILHVSMLIFIKSNIDDTPRIPASCTQGSVTVYIYEIME